MATREWKFGNRTLWSLWKPQSVCCIPAIFEGFSLTFQLHPNPKPFVTLGEVVVLIGLIWNRSAIKIEKAQKFIMENTQRKALHEHEIVNEAMLSSLVWQAETISWMHLATAPLDRRNYSHTSSRSFYCCTFRTWRAWLLLSSWTCSKHEKHSKVLSSHCEE